MCLEDAAFRRGRRHPDIILVGACPGRAEAKNNRPFAGASGRNLKRMLQVLRADHPEIFPSDDPDDYSMLNAHPLPRFNKKGQPKVRTQPTKGEVMEARNRARLGKCLKGMAPNTVLYLGERAEYVDPIVKTVCPEAQIIRTGHPSPLAWRTRNLVLPAGQRIEKWTRDNFCIIRLHR